MLQIPAQQVNQVATIRIFDNLGRLVQQHQIDKITTREVLDIATLPNGQYNIQFQTARMTTSTILIIQ